jgi:TrmH family RNA methyltransferase
MISKSTTKYIQSLQQKKFRDAHGSFIAEGPKVVGELLQENIFECEHLFYTGDGVNFLTGKESFQSAGEIKEHEMEKISALATASNVLAVFKKKSAYEHPSLKDKITLVLDEIQDPGNLGTIIRNADWFGVENIICSKGTADAYNPKVVQSTMASLGRVNILYTNINDWLAQQPSVKKYAAVLGGKDLSSFGKIREGIIIIGNESKGVSPEVQKLADEKITIPRIGAAESLNAAVAAGIILYGLRVSG